MDTPKPESSSPSNSSFDPTIEARTCVYCGSQVAGPPSSRTSQDSSTAQEALIESSVPLDPLAGTVLAGRYRLLERIGRGGMGLVYKVEHTELRKLLAIKLLAGGLGSDRRMLRRFQREALLVSRLSHPNTVQVFDYGRADNFTYLVMELVHGKDLSQIVKMQGPLPVQRLVPISIQVCNSLAEAHALGMVHRDIKLGNIMVSSGAGEGPDLVKVLDFGLAKLRDAPELAEVTGTGGIVGTPQYMAPEQIRGGAVDGRTDVYSLGAVLYRCLTGEPVFSGGATVLFDKHFNEKPQPPHLRAPALRIPQALSAIVLKALEKKPEDRYQRVEDLREALIALEVITEHRLQVLLDTTQLHQLHRVSEQAAQEALAASSEGIKPKVPATRDDVAAYEKKLKRQRWVSIALAAAVAGGVAWGGLSLYSALTRPVLFSGQEREPNNTSGEATELPFGKTIQGQIGKRLDPQRGDRDLYVVRIPEPTRAVSLRTSALPNMPLCLLVYETTGDTLAAKFCSGRPGFDLAVPAFRLQPGRYYLAVLQDRDLRTPPPATPVVENVSDNYELSVQPADLSTAQPPRELEPNDSVPAASELSPGQEVVGSLGWLDDLDFVCASPAAQGAARGVRWVVADAVDRARDRGIVLEVTPNHGSRPGVALRLHRSNAEGTAGNGDRIGPWRSDSFILSTEPKTQCLQLRLTNDPWVKPGTAPLSLASQELWSVRIEEAP